MDFSPDLFKLYNEAILRDLESLLEFTISAGGEVTLNKIRYAKNIELLADTEKRNYISKTM